MDVLNRCLATVVVRWGATDKTEMIRSEAAWLIWSQPVLESLHSPQRNRIMVWGDTGWKMPGSWRWQRIPRLLGSPMLAILTACFTRSCQPSQMLAWASSLAHQLLLPEWTSSLTAVTTNVSLHPHVLPSPEQASRLVVVAAPGGSGALCQQWHPVPPHINSTWWMELEDVLTHLGLPVPMWGCCSVRRSGLGKALNHALFPYFSPGREGRGGDTACLNPLCSFTEW